MIKLTIDGKAIEVDDGTTILDAARKVGVEIPTLCHFKGIEPPVSCFVCVVKIKGSDGFVPSCVTRVHEGMVVESSTEEVFKIRRQALELLLSHHNGDCEAPCTRICPCSIDIPELLRKFMLRDIRSMRCVLDAAMPFPAVLSHICSAPCEKGCRRKQIDTAVSIKELHKFSALAAINSFKDSTPFVQPPTGKKVAIIGAGLAGLTVAYHLSSLGHACTVIEKYSRPGGPLNELDEHILPTDILDYEIDQIRKCGVTFQFDNEVTSLHELSGAFDATVIACGSQSIQWIELAGIRCTERGIEVQKGTFATSVEGVFAVGGAIIPGNSSSRTVGQSKAAALAIHCFLSGIHKIKSAPVGTGRDLSETFAPSTSFAPSYNTGTAHDLSLQPHNTNQTPPETGTDRSRPVPAFDSYMGKLSADDLKRFADAIPEIKRTNTGSPDQMPIPAPVSEIATRCLQCDCGKKTSCDLRRYAAEYGAQQNRYKLDKPLKSERRIDRYGLVYEPGKCILCGRCVGITANQKFRLGLTFMNRGSNVYVDSSFGFHMYSAIGRRVTNCVKACPTGALWRIKYSDV